MKRRVAGWVWALALAWAGGAAAAGPHVVTVHALDPRFDAPERIPSGPTAFAFFNKGWKTHRMRVLRVAPDQDLEALAAALTAGDPLPAGATALGGTLAQRAEGAADVILALEPGPHVLACDVLADGAHDGRALVQPLEVLRFRDAALPAHDLEIRLGDAGIAAPVVVTPGPHALRVANDAARPLALAVARLRPGRGLAQARAWLRGDAERSPLLPVAGTAPLSPGRAVLLVADLPEGDYVVYAPAETAAEGAADAAHLRALAVRGQPLD